MTPARLQALAAYAHHIDALNLYSDLSRIERAIYHASAECRRRYIAQRVDEARREFQQALREVRRREMN